MCVFLSVQSTVLGEVRYFVTVNQRSSMNHEVSAAEHCSEVRGVKVGGDLQRKLGKLMTGVMGEQNGTSPHVGL